ncbi:MAG: exosortase/archaeosortase family protein [Cytophagales bacterium]|nr:exosortase/archaeosortase family protein [Armatimonadota bacterium]
MNKTLSAPPSAASAPRLAAAPETDLPLVPLGVIAALFAALYWDTFAFMMGRWVADESAQHGWLVLPIAGYITWSKRDKLRALPMRSSAAGLWLVVLAMLLHLSEKALDLNGPSPLSIPIFVAGAIWYVAGGAWLRELAFPVAYLLFMVPIPGFLNQFVSFPLRLLATNGAKAIVAPLNIDIVGAGMNIEFWRPGSDHSDPGNLVKFIVADPCSGLHSLMAIKALHAITAYLSRLSLTWKWVLFWCAMPISLAANVCRMVLIILVSAYLDKPIENLFGLKNFGLGLFHTASPYILFIFVFAILISVGRLMERLTGATKATAKPGEVTA